MIDFLFANLASRLEIDISFLQMYPLHPAVLLPVIAPYQLPIRQFSQFMH